MPDRKEKDRRYFERHKEEIYARTKKWTQANPEWVAAYQTSYRRHYNHRAAYLKRIYNITPEDYNRLLTEQHGVCAICIRPPKEGTFLKVDHDHQCCPGEKSCGKCIRGLLCSNCNAGLGFFKDSYINLNMAIDYLSGFDLESQVYADRYR